MAGLWKLPVIYFIENNLFGMGTSVSRASHCKKLYAKFNGFPGLRVDGMDVYAVRETLKVVKNYSIEHGPIFMEVDTYRYHGHSMSDPGTTYRTKDEVSQIRSTRDCIEKVKQLALLHNIASENELKEIEKTAKAKVEADVEQCKKDPIPDLKELYTDVYCDNEKVFLRGIEYENSHFPN